MDWATTQVLRDTLLLASCVFSFVCCLHSPRTCCSVMSHLILDVSVTTLIADHLEGIRGSTDQDKVCLLLSGLFLKYFSFSGKFHSDSFSFFYFRCRRIEGNRCLVLQERVCRNRHELRYLIKPNTCPLWNCGLLFSFEDTVGVLLCVFFCKLCLCFCLCLCLCF